MATDPGLADGASARAEGLLAPAELARRLGALREEMQLRRRGAAPALERVHAEHRRSAENLIDYLTLRRHDVRPLQAALAALGLSSLGRSEEHVISSVEKVLAMLRALGGDGEPCPSAAAVGFAEGPLILRRNAERLLGPEAVGRSTRIIVTMSTEAAEDPAVARALVRAGMDCARVNGAHDDPEVWARTAANVRAAASAVGRTCPVLLDLPGPKLRTGPVARGPKVVRLRPLRDARGRAVTPAGALLVPTGADTPADPLLPAIPVPRAFLAHLRAGARIHLRDARGSGRVLRVVAVTPSAARITAWDTTYLETGTRLLGPRGNGTVGELPPVEQALRLRVGDVLTLTATLAPAPAAPRGAVGDSPAHLRIGCSEPAALRALRVGHAVWFDDGKVGGRVRAVRPDAVDVLVTAAAAQGTNLKGGRGINFPDSELAIAAFSPEDPVLAAAVAHADLVGLSFAQRRADVVELQRQLAARGRPDLGLVLKIETAPGFQRLPELLLAAMASERVGVMVARGDLAVECGFERLAEVQEEILWLCDAGHVPVIWATQVLDQMARTGQPSRAEVSDAVMAARSECVMLNKGPHICDAVVALDDILRRMQTHQHKKVPLLRRLRSWSPE